MFQPRRMSLIGFVLLGVVGCGSSTTVEDVPSVSDVQTTDTLVDSGGSIDSGTPSETGVRVDSGTPPDTGVRVDSGTSADASSNTDLTSLPADTGGTHTAVMLGTSTAEFGYYVYTPGGYTTNTQSYPLLVFLHGKGERGNGTTQLTRVLTHGPPKLIQAGRWAPRYPMIVVSPQFFPEDGIGNENNWGEGNPAWLRNFIAHVKSQYRVNAARVYLTGLSHGGNGVFDYLAQQEQATSHITAAVPIAAWGGSNGAPRHRVTPIWVFVGSADTGNFNASRTFINSFNGTTPPPPVRARFSVYAGAGHDVWTRTYDLSGMNMADPMYDQYDMNLYDWMFQYTR